MNSRNKGNTFEVGIVKRLKEIGYDFAKTTRNSSRVLDACKIDIDFVPYLIQCKIGYDKARPKADKIFKEMYETLKKEIPKESPLHFYPCILVHHIDNRNKLNQLFTTTSEFGFELLRIHKLYLDGKLRED
jgi:hypothetical protein